MPRKAANREDLRTRLAELSGWQAATRDDAAVAQWIHERRAMDQVYPLNEAAFFDELFHDIREASNGRRYVRRTPGAEPPPPMCTPAGQRHDLQ